MRVARWFLPAVVAVALVPAVSASPGHQPRHAAGLGLEALLDFQQRAVAHHRYVCLRGNPLLRRTRWHCVALRWSSRELRETRIRWEHAWWLWLPRNWQLVGACESGGGQVPGNWAHANGSYLSAFGISVREYDRDAAFMGVRGWPRTRGGRIDFSRHPTPWEQYQAAVGHYRRFGDGWGCPGP